MSTIKQEVESVMMEIDKKKLNFSFNQDPLSTTPKRSCDLAEKYLLTPVQNAVIERTFSLQNLIITARRSRILLSNVGMKLFVKYCKSILTEDEIDDILRNATLMWLTDKNRRN